MVSTVQSGAEQLWQCANQQCASVLHGPELRYAQVNNLQVPLCPHCGERVVTVKRESETDLPGQMEDSFVVALAGTPVYPFRGRGVFILIAGTITLAIARFAGEFTVSRGMALLLFAYGYLSAYMFDIVLTTANNDNEPPEFPDFSDL